MPSKAQHPKLSWESDFELDVPLTFDECIARLEELDGQVERSLFTGRIEVIYFEAVHQKSADFSLQVFQKGREGWAIGKVKLQRDGAAKLVGRVGVTMPARAMILFGMALCFGAVSLIATYPQSAGYLFFAGIFVMVMTSYTVWFIKQGVLIRLRKNFS